MKENLFQFTANKLYKRPKHVPKAAETCDQ